MAAAARGPILKASKATTGSPTSFVLGRRAYSNSGSSIVEAKARVQERARRSISGTSKRDAVPATAPYV